jgi:two-component system cell cycle response regulator DivK
MKKRVFICDDDEDILFICRHVLEREGFEVVTSNNNNNITEMVKGIGPDVILMDNWVPDMGGVAASKALKSSTELRHIPIIYFSANNDVVKLAREAGADSYLEKPFEITDLVKVIRSLV